MITVLVHRAGATARADAVDPTWLRPDAPETFWVDIESAGEAEHRLLADTFQFHELAIEDALAEAHHPKIETYGDVLYLILHGIAAGARHHGFVTHDVDFFLGRNYLVTVHKAVSRSIDAEQQICLRNEHVLREGAGARLHRIVDRMVDHYGPEVDGLEDRVEKIERTIFGGSHKSPLRDLLRLKADIASLRRVTLPQRDAIGRLARREFAQIPDALAYRFRDVYDHFVRLTEESIFLQDRVTGLLDAHLAIQSNRLNAVMKVLTVIATIFMPLTVLTGMYGMNVALPDFPGGAAAQFWWVFGIMVGLSAIMLWLFRRLKWL